MLIRKLVVAATLAAAGAAAYAGPTSTGGKDVGNLTDALFGSKMYTGLAVNATPAAAPLVEVASPATGADLAGSIGGVAADVIPMPVLLPAISAPADTAPAILAPGLVTPMADVPEPASMALMLAGMMGVGALRRRKQQR